MPDVSAVFTDLLTDTLYLVVGTEVLPDLRAAALTGVWRGKIIIANDHPGFGWLRVNGDLGGSVVVRVYGNEVLHFTSPAITTRAPVRMPAGRFREWEIEVESAVRITSVTLASSAAELAQT